MTSAGQRWLAAFGLALMTAACAPVGTSDGGGDASPIIRRPAAENEFTPVEIEETIDKLVAEINKKPSEPMQMAVLLKAATGFFAPIVKGATRAMGELDATGNVLGSPEPPGDQERDMELQNREIEQVLMDGAEAIGITPFGEANAAAIDAAVAKGVHVVTLDSDLATSKRSIYVGTLSQSAGAKAGETLLAALPSTTGTVVIHGNADPTWVDGVNRTQGAQDVLEAAGYKTVVRQATWSDEGEAEDVEWMKTQLETADPPAVGLIGLFDIAFRCAIAAEAAGKPGLPVVTFDFHPRTVDYMREGRIKATLIQRQYYQGYLVPYILQGIKNIGLDATRGALAPRMVDDSRFDLGLDVVPAHKVDAYNDFLAILDARQ
ncbi:sugar ABC transporter [Sorangium cellulosum]|uniref:Sugar ABC transporter n=1 Tax=Sorangium cellulosum TaxID=56 RepID=A0A2L0F1Q3_SORCE|nr:substrate-binding domain-containing protein [Sorangium cellulosum]AUX45466.1 sugar ABC transporter [Sorangium cellulosum]